MRLLFEKNKQKELIKLEKQTLNLTWKKFAEKLNIKYGKLISYLNEDVLLSEEIFNKLDNNKSFKQFILDKKSDNWGQIRGGKTSI